MSGIVRLPSPPAAYSQRDQAELRRALETFLASVQGLAGVSSGGGSGGGLTQGQADLLYAALVHTHAQSDITGLVSALAGKQATLAQGTVTATTGSLANAATETGTVALGKNGFLLKVVADRACWVRLYGTSAERSADSARLITADPDATVPVLADLIFDASLLTIPCAPLIGYTNRDGSPVTDIYYSIQNLSGSSHTVQVDFTRLDLES